MIDTKALRSRILDLAIQGKLTEQLPSDGTAEELYQQIQAEKQALIKEGKIKKEKPLLEISADEVPFEIPNNWKWVRWGEIVNIVSARRVHQSDWKKEGIPFYRAREIAKLAEDGYVDNDLFISEELYEEFSKSGIPHAGDLMISAVGTLGKAYIVKEEDKFYYKDASVLCIENIGKIEAGFLIAVLKSDLMKKQIESNSGGTTVDTLTMVRMIMYLLPLPPLAEQKRIVERVEEIFRLLDTIDEAQEKYSADSQILKAKLITAGIQGKLTKQLPSDGTAEELYQQIQAEKQKLIKEGKLKKEKPLPPVSPEEVPFEIPENWMWVRLQDIGSTNIGLTYHPTDVSNNGTIVIRSSNIQNGKMDYTDIVRVNCKINDNQYLNKNDIVICARNGSKSLVGKNAVYDGESNKVAFGAFMAVYRTICFQFIYYYFNTFAFKRYFSSDDSKQINQVTQAILKESVVPLPPLAEQKRIADVLERALGALE